MTRVRTVLTSLALGGGLLGLAACETVPYAERVAAFEASINQRFVGKPVDDLVLELGPPLQSYELSDGRQVFQYDRSAQYTTGGGSYTTFETYSRAREVIGPDGKARVVRDTRTVPVQRIDPIRTYDERCVRRFVISKDKMVESFRWEGNACF